MTAIEFMQKQLHKCEINLEKEQKRGASEEVLQAIRDKIRFYGEAVEALDRPHGRWVNIRMLVGGFAEKWGADCSHCGKTFQEPLGNYCRECGWAMELEE